MSPQSALLFMIASVLSTLVASSVSIDLGSCEGLAIQSGTAVSFAGALTTVASGSVGVSPGTAVSGNYLLSDGTVEVNTATSIQCAADLKTAYSTAAGAVCTNSGLLDLAGMTLAPGVYCGGAISFSASTLTLDGGGDSNAQWIFQASSTLTSATATSFVLTNGAQASNVYWAVGTSASIGYASSFVGTILAQTAITVGTTGVVTGRLLAETAVSFAGGSMLSLPVGTISTAAMPAVAARKYLRSSASYAKGTGPSLSPRLSLTAVTIPLGSCSAFALEAGTAVTFNGGVTTVTSGSVGVSPGDSVGGSYQLLDGTVQINTDSAIACAADRVTAYEAATGASCSASNYVSELSGLTLAPGVYCSASSISISATTLTLDAGGDANAQWIFQAGKSLTTAPATSIILVNGAQAKNVFWAVGSSASIGYSSAFVGNIIADASISFGHNSMMVGRGLAGAAVSFESTSTVGLPML